MIDEDLGLNRHRAEDGRLAFFRAERATVLFGREDDNSYRKLCQIIFNKKSGAVYVQFTYFRTDPGVVGYVTSKVNPGATSSVTFNEGGKVATNLVKYSHPPDGRAHFSQDGSHKTQFWSESLDLGVDEGHLFEIHAFHLEPFQVLQKNEAKGKRLYLPFQAPGLPSGVTVAVEWARLDRIREIADPGAPSAGPVSLIPRRSDGKLFRAALLAPPRDSPFDRNVLLINVAPAQLPVSVDTPMLFFMGGWRKTQTFAAGSEVSFLSFWYPVQNPSEMAGKLGLADHD